MASVFDQLDQARRLQDLGVDVRSRELAAEAERIRAFFERGGNRRMRRANARVHRRKGG